MFRLSTADRRWRGRLASALIVLGLISTTPAVSLANPIVELPRLLRLFSEGMGTAGRFFRGEMSIGRFAESSRAIDEWLNMGAEFGRFAEVDISSLSVSELLRVQGEASRGLRSLRAFEVEATPIPPASSWTSDNATAYTSMLQRSLRRPPGRYKGAIDGVFGPETKRALLEFQRAEGLVPDGAFGPRTAFAMKKAEALAAQAAQQELPRYALTRGSLSSDDVTALYNLRDARGELVYSGDDVIRAVESVQQAGHPGGTERVLLELDGFTSQEVEAIRTTLRVAKPDVLAVPRPIPRDLVSKPLNVSSETVAQLPDGRWSGELELTFEPERLQNQVGTLKLDPWRSFVRTVRLKVIGSSRAMVSRFVELFDQLLGWQRRDYPTLADYVSRVRMQLRILHGPEADDLIIELEGQRIVDGRSQPGSALHA